MTRSSSLLFQIFCSTVIWPYYHTAYRIRGWGRLPRLRGATLVLCNHQHDLDTTAVIMKLVLDGPLNDPVYSAGSRRMFEPGFMGTRLRWLETFLRRFKATDLFSALGVFPIENELRTRAIFNFAGQVHERHGDVNLGDVFPPEALEPLGPHAAEQPLSAVFSGAMYRTAAETRFALKRLRDPYKSEILEESRARMEGDLQRLEAALKRGVTFFLTPEGRYSKDGRLSRLRSALPRLLPLASEVWAAALSYDMFVGPRLSLLFHIAPIADRKNIAASMQAPRPVTVSQLLGDWLYARAQERGTASTDRENAFTGAEAFDAVQARLGALPDGAFVDPELAASPAHMTRAALTGLLRLGTLEEDAGGYRVTEQRTHPQFPGVNDSIAYQAHFFQETLAAWRFFQQSPETKAGLGSQAVAPS